jgi:hypothetical protein
MANSNDIIDDYKRYTQALAQANRINKDMLFEALSTAGITAVNVEFDGEGDSGQIGDITLHSGGVAVPLPTLHVTLSRAAYSTGKLDSAQASLREAIETLCYDFLSQEQGGWENDGGAYGEFTFDVASRKIDLEFNARFTDSTLFTYSF